MKYSSNLIKEANKYLKIQFEKRFIQGIKNGTLEEKRFNNWLKADYPYLINMLKVVSIGKVKAEDKEDISITPIGIPIIAGPGAITSVNNCWFDAEL